MSDSSAGTLSIDKITAELTHKFGKVSAAVTEGGIAVSVPIYDANGQESGYFQATGQTGEEAARTLYAQINSNGVNLPRLAA